MRSCTVTRTHRFGIPINNRDFDKPTEGPVLLSECYNAKLKRNVRTLCINRDRQIPNPQGAIPDLHDPEMIAFQSDRSVMFRGFEEIDGTRYYQGWWIQWK